MATPSDPELDAVALRLPRIWALWALTRSLLLALVVIAQFRIDWLDGHLYVAGDVARVYFGAYQKIDAGLVPYRDFPLEYPPGVLPLSFLPAPVETIGGYVVFWACLMVVVDALTLLPLTKLARRWGSSRGVLLWVWGGFILGPVILTRNDLLVCLPVAWAALALDLGALALVGALLAWGGLTKLWPLLLLPLLLLLLREWPARLRLVLGATLVLGLAALGLVLTRTLLPLRDSVLGYHSDRPIEIEALLATPSWVARLLTGRGAATELTYGSVNLVSEHTALLVGLSTILTVLTLAGVWGAALVLSSRSAAQSDSVSFSGLSLREATRSSLWVELSLVLVVVSVLSAKVLSPQYLLWILVLAAAAAAAPHHSARLSQLLLVACAFTFALYPTSLGALMSHQAQAIVVLLARNLTLVALALFLILRLVRAWRPTRRADQTA